MVQIQPDGSCRYSFIFCKISPRKKFSSPIGWLREVQQGPWKELRSMVSAFTWPALRSLVTASQHQSPKQPAHGRTHQTRLVTFTPCPRSWRPLGRIRPASTEQPEKGTKPASRMCSKASSFGVQLKLTVPEQLWPTPLAHPSHSIL